MVRLPVLTELKVTSYGLFPGEPRGSGINWLFQPGLTLIAGINGLGKTTLLTMILRSFTGPYDLTSYGESQSLSVTLPERPVILNPQYAKFFEQRVADGAKEAKVTVSARFDKAEVTIYRRLKDLFLESLIVDGKSIKLPQASEEREAIFQSRLTELIGLSSFVDALLVLHYVILYHENRLGALWDPNAQRHLLRALCLDRDDALRMADLERNLQSADSQARNINVRITATRTQLSKALQREAGSEDVLTKIKAEQELLDAELVEADQLGQMLEQLDENRKDARLAHERAKIEREDAAGAVERMKYAALLNHFPRIDDTTRLALSRIMSDSRCLVCNASAKDKQLELEQQVASGCCPICGAEPKAQDNVVAAHEVDQARLQRERERVERAKLEEETRFQQLRDFSSRYDQTLERIVKIRQSIKERGEKNRRLRTRLPETITSSEYENTLKTLSSEHREWQERRATYSQELRSLLAAKEEAITAKSNELIETFSRMIGDLLVDEARLVQARTQPRYIQALGQLAGRIQFPAYIAEMRAADRPGYIRRSNQSEVSESQRELIDLAFRLALIKVFGGPCTFVMETPEASLDGLAMERVGLALAKFSQGKGNRLVVTSNLANTGIIATLFSGSLPKERLDTRMKRVLNLLQIAAPNRALNEDRDRYSVLLKEAVS